jgi:hypothetical protein
MTITFDTPPDYIFPHSLFPALSLYTMRSLEDKKLFIEGVVQERKGDMYGIYTSS